MYIDGITAVGCIIGMLFGIIIGNICYDKWFGGK